MKLIYDLDATNTFEVEENLDESSGKKTKKYKISGVFSTIGKRNRNGRIYPKNLWESQVTNYQDNFSNGSINTLMEYEHPARANIKPMDAVAKITKLNVEGDYVIGEAVLLNNERANKLKDLIDNGIKLSVSSRAVGTINNGIVEKFKLITYDIVSAPSDYNATMNGVVESYQLNEGIIEDLNFSLDDYGNIVPFNENLCSVSGACDMYAKDDIHSAIETKFNEFLEKIKKL